MALSCDIKEQIFTFQGKDYNYNDFRFMMLAGLMDAVESGETFLVAGEGEAKNVVDVLDTEGIDALLTSAKGANALGIGKDRIINQAIRAMNSLVANGFGYNEETGKGVRIFISKTHADHQAAQMAAEGRKQDNRGFIVQRVDDNGNKQGYDIYINLEAASSVTVAHEVMHFYLSNAFGENSALFQKFAKSMADLMNGSDLEYLTNFAKNYERKGEAMVAEEFLVEMGGLITNRIAKGNVTPKEQGIFAKIADLFNEIVYKITKGRLGYTVDVTDKTAVQEFFEALAGSVAEGKAFNQQLAEAARQEVEQQKPTKDAVQERTTAEVGAQPVGTEGAGQEGRGGMGPGVQGPEAPQAGGPQGQVTRTISSEEVKAAMEDTAGMTAGPSSKMSPAYEKLANEIADAIDGGAEVSFIIEGKSRRIASIERGANGRPVFRDSAGNQMGLGSLPAFAGSSVEIRSAKPQWQVTPTAEGPVRPEARESKIPDSNKLKITDEKAQDLIVPGSQILGTPIVSKQSLINSGISDFNTTPPKVVGVRMKYPKAKTIEDVLEASGGAAIFVNSDGTKVGEVYINGKKYLLQGGLDYTFIAKNFKENVGFAASENQKITTLNTIARGIAELRDGLNPSHKGKPVAVFVVSQNGEAMLGEWYAAEYIMEGLDKALSNETYEGGIEAARGHFVKAIKDVVITTKTEDGKKDSEVRNKLVEMIESNLFDSHRGRMKIADYLSSKDVSFGLRSKINGEIIAANPKFSERGKNKEIKKALADNGHHLDDFWKSFADERFLPLVEKEPRVTEKGKVFANKTFSGFYYDPSVSIQDQIKHTEKGIKHRQFNSKFKSVGEPFLLTKAHDVNKLFPDMGYADSEGYDIYNRENKTDVSKKSPIGERLKVSEWLNQNGYNKNVINPYSSISLSIYTGYVTEEYKKKAPEAKESKISQLVSAPTGTQAMPSSTLGITPEITSRESKIVKVFDQTGFISVQSMVDSLINDREYLNSVIASILEAREILKKGKVRPEAVVAAYLITIGSKGSSGSAYSVWSSGGKTMSKVFLEKKEGRDWVRPEGAAAAYLYTDAGKKLIEDFISGTATRQQITDMFLFIGMGRENSNTRDAFNTMQSGGIKKMTDLLNANKGKDFDKLYEGGKQFLSGIAVGKTGFFNQYFGVSGRAVLDAREWNAWIAGQMVLTKEQMERRKKYEVSPEVQQMLLDRIEEVGLALGYSKDLAGYIAHHAIWDAVADTITEHAGEYAVIKEYQKPKAERRAKLSVIAGGVVNEESREFITIVQRRIDKLGFDGRNAEAQILKDKELFKDPDQFQEARKAAGDLFATMLYDPAITALPPLEIARVFVDKIDTIDNLPSRIYFAGNVHAFIDDMVMSKKIGKKLRDNLRTLADGVVVDMAKKGREYGQASAMFARVYADFKKFDFLVTKKRFEQEAEAKFNSTQLEDGKNLKDAVEEVRGDVEEILNGSPELSEVIDLAGEVNEVYMGDHADAVAQGDISGLKDPKMVTAEEFIEQKNKFEEVIRDLEEKIKKLQDQLADVTKLYSNAQTKNAGQAKTIADLRSRINKLNALIDKLRESNKKISAKASYYKQELQKLREKFANLKSLLAILKANKNISKQRQDKMMQALVDMIAGGRLSDPDFASVFGEVFEIAVINSKDMAALESLANGLKYLAENPNSEISQVYIKKFNDYLEAVSIEKWDSYRFFSAMQSLYYNSILSGVSTTFNATFGSLFTGIPNAIAYSVVNSILNPSTAIGSFWYGMRRMAMETPAAVSKGIFAQRAYDNLGVTWNGENLTDKADVAEVHIVNGFFRNLDKIKKGGIKSVPKNLVPVLLSVVYPLTHIKRLMMFIDPTVTHMLSSYVQGGVEYKRAVQELKAASPKASNSLLDVMTVWSSYLNLSHIKKIDEHVNYAKKNRKAAAEQALAEIEELNQNGIKVPKDYARRRTSEILREKLGAERALEIDKLTRDWLMMWRPDGIIGSVWEVSTEILALKRDNEKYGGPYWNAAKTITGMLFFTFLRITSAGVNIVQSTLPIVSLPLALVGVRKNHQENRGKEGRWGFGYKYKTSEKGVLAPLNPISIYKDLKKAEDFESRRTITRIGVSLLSNIIIYAMLDEMFDFGDEDDEDKTGYVELPLLGWVKLNEDRRIDITASGTGQAPKGQESQEGRVSFAVRFRRNKDDKWGPWMSSRLVSHLLAPIALIGRAADDAKGIYYNPKGTADIAKPAKGIIEYGSEIPLAIGEWSFSGLGKLWSQSRYDASGAMTKFLLNPFYAIMQPRAVSDIITTTEDMLNLPKKDTYTGEGAKDAVMNLTYSMYGMGRLIAPDATDQFGIPVKVINPVTNWWAYINEERLRSIEHPEWNLAYRFQNTYIPSPISFRINAVERTDSKGNYISSEKKKFLSDYEKYVELTEEETTLATNAVKSLFREMVLAKYDELPAEATMYLGSDYIDPGEYMSNKLQDILKESKKLVKEEMTVIANEKDLERKQKLMDRVFQAIVEKNRRSSELVKDILSRGPLPKTGLGSDVKRRAPIK